jgi:hypothetical protein
MRKGVILLCLAGVGGVGTPDETPEPLVVDSAGVRVVEYHGLPRVPPTPIPEGPFFQLGVMEGDPTQEFEYVSVAMADSAAFEVRDYTTLGELGWILRVTGQPRAVTAEDTQGYRDDLLDREPDVTRHPRILQEVGALLFPETHPALRRLYLDRLARLCVEENRLPWETRSWFLVLGQDGGLRARILLPAGHSLLEAGARYLLTRFTDSLGVQYVRMFDTESL